MSKPIDLDGLDTAGGKGRRAPRAIDPCRKYFISDQEYHEWATHQHGKYRFETHGEYIDRQERYYFLSAKIDQYEVLAFWDEYRHRIRQQKSHAGYELGPREFTLTYSPDWFDDEKAMFFMTQAIDRLCGYYRNEIIELRAVGERTKAGRAHIHVYYELKGGLKITDKNLKRAYFKWDSKHHHHKVVRKTSNFLGYIDKDKDAWLQKNNF